MRIKLGTHTVVRRLAVPVAALALAVAGAACSGGSSSGAIGTGAAVNGHAQHGGTVTVGWENATPNFIFPLVPATNTDGYNVNLSEQMWPYLVYSGDGAKSIVNPQNSLYSSITYSDNDTKVTIGLKHWNWSDGVPITSRDFTFVYNLLKANVPNWNLYVPGLFPTDVASVATPDSHTVVLNLTHSYNPSFYTEDVLTTIPLLPQHAWDKTSVSGKVGNYDETTAGAKAVYSFLQQQGGQMSTFDTNPLWKVVDGPWQLSQFVPSTGYYVYVPNKHYSGPQKAYLSKVVNEPFTTDTAELDELRAGSSLDVGNLPFNDLRQVGILKSEGYSIAAVQVAGVAEIMPNLYNATVGPILRQLYIRQAMEDLINRPQIVSKVYEGYADPGNGPIPLSANGPWASPLEKSGGPYRYSPSTATALLKSHGWKVAPGGTSTCQRPGTGGSDCGAGITAGQPLSFQLVYSSGVAGMDEQNAAIQSSEEQGGVKIALKSEPFNTIAGTVGTCTASSAPASTCGWQLADFGYDPYTGPFPSGAGFFNTGGYNNLGGYSDPEMNQLINNTEYGSSPQTFFTYEDYAARQLPWLWIPNADYIFVYRSNLAGFAPLNPFSGSTNPQDWYYTS
jgi:peptide/nickel transport system substrate-binding protein